MLPTLAALSLARRRLVRAVSSLDVAGVREVRWGLIADLADLEARLRVPGAETDRVTDEAHFSMIHNSLRRLSEVIKRSYRSVRAQKDAEHRDEMLRAILEARESGVALYRAVCAEESRATSRWLREARAAYAKTCSAAYARLRVVR